MKYIASTRPMIRNMMTWSRLCASGCRDTPAMVALPASPSPTAAPMAPPPSASPAPISAPAMAIAWVIARSSSSVCGGVGWGGAGAVLELLQALARLAAVDDRQQHEDE